MFDDNKDDATSYDIAITGYHLIEEPPGNKFNVYTIQVQSENVHLVERRYNEFHALHCLLKKESAVESQTVPFPPKRLRNTGNPKFLEKRRLALEQYIQTMIKLPSTKLHVLNFLGVDAKQAKESNESAKNRSKIEVKQSINENRLEHPPVLIFQWDPWMRDQFNDDESSSLPDIVTKGVLTAFEVL